MISSFYQRSTHIDIPVRTNNNRNNTIHRPNTMSSFYANTFPGHPVTGTRELLLFASAVIGTFPDRLTEPNLPHMSESVLSSSLPSPSKMYLAASAAVKCDDWMPFVKAKN